jgi:hypothetical protein
MAFKMIKFVEFQNLEECKKYVKEKLQETDYVTLNDVKDKIYNYEEFIQYRSFLRKSFLNPSLYLYLTEPDPIWRNS